jgi:hypothetical protein
VPFRLLPPGRAGLTLGAMSGLTRIVVLVMALMSPLGMAASAEAVTWDNLGNTAFTATAGALAFTSTGVQLTCTTSTSTGTAAAVATGAVLTVPLTAVFSPCHLAGVASALECRQTFTGTTQDGGLGGPITGTLDTTCSLYQSGTKVCHILGALSASYLTPVSSFGGSFTSVTGSLLAVIHGSNGTCPLGDADPLHVPPTSRRIISATGGSGFGGPRFTRTP